MWPNLESMLKTTDIYETKKPTLIMSLTIIIIEQQSSTSTPTSTSLILDIQSHNEPWTIDW